MATPVFFGVSNWANPKPLTPPPTIKIDVSSYANPYNTTVLGSVFGAPGDTSPKQAEERANQVDPPFTGAVDASKAIDNAVGNAVDKVKTGVTTALNTAGLAVAGFLMIFILIIFKR